MASLSWLHQLSSEDLCGAGFLACIHTPDMKCPATDAILNVFSTGQLQRLTSPDTPAGHFILLMPCHEWSIAWLRTLALASFRSPSTLVDQSPVHHRLRRPAAADPDPRPGHLPHPRERVRLPLRRRAQLRRLRERCVCSALVQLLTLPSPSVPSPGVP